MSIVIFFIFFISIFISHQNLNNLNLNEVTEYFIESEKNEKLKMNIVNSSNEKKLNIDIDYDKETIGNFNFVNKFVISVNLPLLNNSPNNPCIVPENKATPSVLSNSS